MMQLYYTCNAASMQLQCNSVQPREVRKPNPMSLFLSQALEKNKITGLRCDNMIALSNKTNRE